MRTETIHDLLMANIRRRDHEQVRVTVYYRLSIVHMHMSMLRSIIKRAQSSYGLAVTVNRHSSFPVRRGAVTVSGCWDGVRRFLGEFESLEVHTGSRAPGVDMEVR